MSGFVPDFDSDIFISYAHKDGVGWANMFEEVLSAKLLDYLGAEVSIWKDVNNLRVGEDWQAEIEIGIQKAAIFIAILSPIYKNSDWCAQELDIFRHLFDSLEQFEKSGRFFKIIKTPWENDRHLSFWPKILSMDLFKSDKGRVGLKPGSVAFNNAIGVLVEHSLAPMLRQLRRARERIFVATPARDCREVSKELREDLFSKGYLVQPEGPLSEGYADKDICDEIGNALLSIHLLGTVYDPFVQRQIQLAADLERRLMFWFAPGKPDEKQAQLIKSLRAGRRPDRPDLELPPGWDAFDDLTPRRFIEQVVAALTPQQAVTAPPPRSGGPSRLYIVHDAKTEKDSQLAAELQGEIEAQEHFDVLLYEADQSRHRELLRTCEGVLLYREEAPETWLDQVAPDVLLTERLFDRPPLKSRAFLRSKATKWDEWPDLKVFPYGPQFKPGDLEPFLASLRG